MIKIPGKSPARRQSVAFLFLGELFLIPHLLPIAAALARTSPTTRISLFVISSIHEEIIAGAVARLGIADAVTLRRAAGFRHFPSGSRIMPDLPPKMVTLALNALAILRHDVVMVAERTSLWLPRITRRHGPAFIYNEHGAAPHANFASPRNRFATRLLMPSEGMAQRVREAGHRDAPIEVVGYIKRDYMRQLSGTGALPAFPEARKTVVYVPHWLRCKSSWWSAGEAVLEHFARSTDYNLVVAPHIRLTEADPDFHDRVRRFRDYPNIRIDAGSFSLIDQTYINGADLYLGDGSSQVVEFAERPRPVIFLNPDRHDWRSDPRFSHWQMGDVIERVDQLDAALAAADRRHARYAPLQRAYVERMMGHDDGAASLRAAAVCRELLARRVAPPVRATATVAVPA